MLLVREREPGGGLRTESFASAKAFLKGIVKTQREILETGAVKTKAGGRLIYITCSILAEEDEQQIDSFFGGSSGIYAR